MTIEELKAALSDGINPLHEQVKSVDAEVKDVKSRLEKIEKLPLGGFPAINKIPTSYKGYRLDRQMDRLMPMIERTKGLTTLDKEEGQVGFAKWMLMSILAKRQDISARQDLADFYKTINMSEGTTTEGGYLVPQEYDWDIIKLVRNNSYMLNLCTVIPMTRDIMNIPKETTNVSVAWTSEKTAATQTEPVLGTLQLNTGKLDGYGQMTNELLQDSAVDVVGMLTEQFVYAIGQELDKQVLNGTGNPCSGLTTSACGNSVVMSAGSSNFSEITGGMLSQMIYALNTGDLANARFVIGRLGMHYVRSLKDSNGRFIYSDIGGPLSSTIWGLPSLVSDQMTNTTAASTAVVVLGNFKKFIIGQRIGAMALDLDPYGLFTQNATQFRMVTRWALSVGRSTAFVRLMTSS